MESPNELFTFLRTHKRYWLLPLVIFVAILGALLYFAERRAEVAPFIYAQGSTGLEESGSRA